MSVGTAYEKNIKLTRKQAVQIATELCYNQYTIKLIKKAKSDDEINKILSNARNGIYDGCK